MAWYAWLCGGRKEAYLLTTLRPFLYVGPSAASTSAATFSFGLSAGSESTAPTPQQPAKRSRAPAEDATPATPEIRQSADLTPPTTLADTTNSVRLLLGSSCLEQIPLLLMVEEIVEAE